MTAFIHGLLTGVPTWVTYAAVFAFPFLEASIFLGFVFPGETALVLGGVTASQNGASLTLLMVFAVVGAITGDAVGYGLGRRYGKAMQRSRLGRLVGERRWETAEEFLRRRGGPAVFVGRFTALLRAMVPTAAGMAQLPYRTFFLWNAVGGCTWAITFVLVGFLAGESYKKIEGYLGTGALVVTGVLVAGLVAFHLVRRHRSSGDREAS